MHIKIPRKCREKLFVIALLFIFPRTSTCNVEIPDRWEKSVVVIGQQYEVRHLSGEIEQVASPVGTGVLLKTDRFVLVTAKHVVFDKGAKLLLDLCFWGNKLDGSVFSPRSFVVKKWPNIRWVPHSNPNIDLAASIVGIDRNEDAVAFMTLDDFKPADKLKKGEDIYYLGFPSGLGARYGSNPLLRKGIVALKEKREDIFYIDATVAGGNSGGPVFSQENGKTQFLGIMSAFNPSFSPDGHFYHTGIGIVYPVDYIKEIIESEDFKKTM